jgi:hypothetical protein
MESSCELGNEPSGSIKCSETTKWLHNLWPLEWYSAPQSQFVMVSVFPAVANTGCSLIALISLATKSHMVF